MGIHNASLYVHNNLGKCNLYTLQYDEVNMEVSEED